MSQSETAASDTATSASVDHDVRRSDRLLPGFSATEGARASQQGGRSSSSPPPPPPPPRPAHSTTTKLPPIASISGVPEGAAYGRQSYNWNHPTLPPPPRHGSLAPRAEDEAKPPQPYERTDRSHEHARRMSFSDDPSPHRLQIPPISTTRASPALPEPTTASALSPPGRHADFPTPSSSHPPAQGAPAPLSTGPPPEPSLASSSEAQAAERVARPASRSKATTHYSLLTMQGEGGPVAYHVPIDVQAASKAADAKRKRNAGASARFRARRKEKEQASTKEIDDLKQQIQDLGDEVDFYRQERDSLVSVLSQTPDWSKHFPRPLSPRHRRRSVQSRSESTPHESPRQTEFSTYQEQGEQGSGGRHTRRRLASDLSEAVAPSTAATHPSPGETSVASPQDLPSRSSPAITPRQSHADVVMGESNTPPKSPRSATAG